MSQCHHHYSEETLKNEKALWWAIVANGALTIFQIIGGLISGSLALIADALHNLSDAASLVIAMVAIRIGKKPADSNKSFGYKRAETIAALINLTTLVLIGFYLIAEAFQRLVAPEAINGWIVIAVAFIALTVDVFTAFITFKRSHNNMNMRAAFLHNLSDALASVGVIIVGLLIIFFSWVWADALITFFIAGLVIYQGLKELPKVIHLLMDGTPADLNISEIKSAMQKIKNVQDVHHIHIRQIDENTKALEAHVVLSELSQIDTIKGNLKKLIRDEFGIEHSTLEFEDKNCETQDCV